MEEKSIHNELSRLGVTYSDLYNLSLRLRKKAKLNVDEAKWISVKRWYTSLGDIKMKPGSALAIKRKEEFIPTPEPMINKTNHVIVMLQNGNVHHSQLNRKPITEEWLLQVDCDGVSNLDKLVKSDALSPLPGYNDELVKLFNSKSKKEGSNDKGSICK